jgi:hypothetical protein
LPLRESGQFRADRANTGTAAVWPPFSANGQQLALSVHSIKLNSSFQSIRKLNH